MIDIKISCTSDCNESVICTLNSLTVSFHTDSFSNGKNTVRLPLYSANDFLRFPPKNPPNILQLCFEAVQSLFVLLLTVQGRIVTATKIESNYCAKCL